MANRAVSKTANPGSNPGRPTMPPSSKARLGQQTFNLRMWVRFPLVVPCWPLAQW